MRVAFIGSAGVPNCYGGFESFVDNCGPLIAQHVEWVKVTCDASLYEERGEIYKNLYRVFLPIRANGFTSVLHDLLAFIAIFHSSTHIIVLGVSGGVWFPFWRILCDLFGKRLLVNIDGVEWRRDKFSATKRSILMCFDFLAQMFSHVVIYDNEALKSYLYPFAICKSIMIPYSGDHVVHSHEIQKEPGTALTICRIEPENNIEMLIEGVLASTVMRYQIVGNWDNSAYGRNLRSKYASENRLILSNPIYDSFALCKIREECDIYIHGHSVGGTNPSLVEILFYDCQIFCFDVAYNRATAEDSALYFHDASSLTIAISQKSDNVLPRHAIRMRYMGEFIANEYIEIMRLVSRTAIN